MEIFKSKNPFITIFKGTILAFMFTVISLLIYSALLVYTDLSENTITPVILIITGISIFIGSSLGTRKLRNNGLFNGAFIGGTYILTIYLISSLINSNFSLNFISFIMIIIRINRWSFRSE